MKQTITYKDGPAEVARLEIVCDDGIRCPIDIATEYDAATKTLHIEVTRPPKKKAKP